MSTTDRRELLNDAETSLRIALNGRQSTIWTAMPCIVQSVNFSKMTVECQPCIQGEIQLSDGTVQNVNLPILGDVPLVFPSAGGFILTLPVQVGDEVLVVFASRCIDQWWQAGGIQKGAEFRMHDLSDGMAIPGPRSIPNVVSGISSTGAQLRNDAGTTYLEIAANGKIKLVSPSSIDITGNLNVTGAIIAQGQVTGSGIALSTHTHPVNVPSTPFSGPTGAPT